MITLLIYNNIYKYINIYIEKWPGQQVELNRIGPSRVKLNWVKSNIRLEYCLKSSEWIMTFRKAWKISIKRTWNIQVEDNHYNNSDNNSTVRCKNHRVNLLPFVVCRTELYLYALKPEVSCSFFFLSPSRSLSFTILISTFQINNKCSTIFLHFLDVHSERTVNII